MTTNITPISLRLTRKVYFAVPTGCFLASNLMTNRFTPVFAETVLATPHERNTQWVRIVAAGADQRLCRIFRDEQECLSWIAALVPPGVR
jgi:hypothetical protein